MISRRDFVSLSVPLAAAVLSPRFLTAAAPDKLQDTTSRGVEFLRTTQAADGSWTSPEQPGISALVVASLLKSGIKVDDATVAKGLMANWCRRQSLERAYLESLAALPEPSMPSAEHQALVREALHLIDAMLDSLPGDARQVFLLAQFEGIGYEEIARRLGISLSTVKRHMKRALVGCLSHVP